MFQVRVKTEPAAKSSPVKVQAKPRRQTRATLAYDRVMFFSDFFRRLESDRRLFALPPVRRNRVYVSPRADDAPAAPVKFPRAPATRKGRIVGIVSAVTRNTGGGGAARPSPFASKRRMIPSHTAWDRKIDLESIEADATLIAQPIHNQWSRLDPQTVPSASAQLEKPKLSPEKSVRQGDVMTAADSTTRLRGDAAVHAESAFTCARKHPSSKMRRKLKRKQRKRSATAAEGGGVRAPTSSDSEEQTPSHRGEERSGRGSKNEQHRPTNSIAVAGIIPPEHYQETRETTAAGIPSHASCPVLKVEPRPAKSPTSVDMRVPAPRGRTIVEILSHIGEQNATPPPQPGGTAADQTEQICPVSVVVDASDDTGRSVNDSNSKAQATISKINRTR